MVELTDEAIESFRRTTRTERIVEELKGDPMILGLLSTRERVEEGRRLLGDKERTAFFFVTPPAALPIAVTERFVRWVRKLDIPVGGVIVNKLLLLRQPELNNASPYVLNQVREQRRYLELIQSKFQGLVRAYVPLYDSEVRGIDMVAEAARALAEEKSM